MTTQEYCAALEQALSPMPPEERQETIRYYLEFLEDANESERAAYIGRIRQISRAVAQSYYDSRERLGFPMCQKKE